MATLLRQRMRWAFLLISAYAVSNIARELTRGAIASYYAKSVIGGNIVLGSVLCLLAVWLWSGRRLSLIQLRRIEIIGIGLAVLLVAIAQHLWFMQARPGRMPCSRNSGTALGTQLVLHRSPPPPRPDSMILSWADASWRWATSTA